MSLHYLPTELVQDIALRLEDQDLSNFRQVSKKIAYCTASDSFYRLAFARKFDLAFDDPENLQWYDMLTEYMHTLKCLPDFHKLGDHKVQDALKVIEKLILGKKHTSISFPKAFHCVITCC
jgi:hypothetical protein